MTLRSLPRTAKQPTLLKADEVSEITRVPAKTLQNWATQAERGCEALGPKHIRLSARNRAWALEDVLDWIEQKRGN